MYVLSVGVPIRAYVHACQVSTCTSEMCIRRAVRGRSSTASNDNTQQNGSPSFRLYVSQPVILHSRHERSAKAREAKTREGGSCDRDRVDPFISANYDDHD